MEGEKKQNVMRGSILKLLGVIVVGIACIYFGRIYMKEGPEEKTSIVDVSEQKDIKVFDIKMSILDIVREKGSLFTEITTAGAPELVSSRPESLVALYTMEKTIDFIKKVTPENMTFILSTSQGTAILKCTEISKGSTPNSVKFKFHQDDGKLLSIIEAYDAQKVSETVSSETKGILLALSYAGFKKEDQNREVPFPVVDRVNYLLIPKKVYVHRGESLDFPWEMIFLGIDKVTVVSLKGKEAEMEGDVFVTKVWNAGDNNFVKTPPNGNFKAHDQNGKSYFFALKFSNPSFSTIKGAKGEIQNNLTFETEFLENEKGQKTTLPILQEVGTFESIDKNGVVVVIDP